MKMDLTDDKSTLVQVMAWRVRSRPVPGRKGPGRPKKTWEECVKQDLKVCGLSEAGTQDKLSWRSSVKNSRQELPRLTGAFLRAWLHLRHGVFWGCAPAPLTKLNLIDWLIGAVRQQVITWANVDPDLCHHMVSLCRNELKTSHSSLVIVYCILWKIVLHRDHFLFNFTVFIYLQLCRQQCGVWFYRHPRTRRTGTILWWRWFRWEVLWGWLIQFILAFGYHLWYESMIIACAFYYVKFGIVDMKI